MNLVVGPTILGSILITPFLSVFVLMSFVVSSTVRHGGFALCPQLMPQLVINIEKLHTPVTELDSFKMYFWLNWSLRCYTVVELFVCWICYVSG